jgi:hypothetical protein
MLDRRSFIQTGLVFPLASFALGALRETRAAAAESETLALDRFVFDARFAEATDVAHAIEQLGIALAPFAGDLTELWYNDLDLRLKQGPIALGGVTTQEGLFVLETLALDHRMRVVYHGEHAVVDKGRLVHTLGGPTALLEEMTGRAEDGHWAAALARAMTLCPLGTPETGDVELATPVAGISLRDVPLHSWIIAPRAAVTVMLKS